MTSPAELLASTHLHTLCEVSPDRRPGSPGNDQAAGYVAQVWRDCGWVVSEQVFDVLDWSGSPGTVRVGRRHWTVVPSPYSQGAEVTRQLVVARRSADLDADLAGRVVLLLDDLASEQLTPLGYPFYGNPVHTQILTRLIEAKPRVVLAGTGKAPQTAGALEPFPLIEDGAFPIPTGNLHRADAQALAEHEGQQVQVDMSAHRWPSTARNVIARLGPDAPRVLLVAHLDSKPGTPGAVDNAAGVVTLLLLARRLAGVEIGGLGVELLAVNGEDCYSAAGELAYLAEHADRLGDIAVVVNVDGVGYRSGGTAYSLYEVPDPLGAVIRGAMAGRERLSEGPAWFASDHMVFAPRGVPAVALTTDRLDVVLTDLVHSPHDTPAQVDVTLLTELSDVLADVVTDVATWSARGL